MDQVIELVARTGILRSLLDRDDSKSTLLIRVAETGTSLLYCGDDRVTGGMVPRNGFIPLRGSTEQ